MRIRPTIAVVPLLALALAGCGRRRAPAPAPVNPADEGTWVAIPGDLTPEQVKQVQRALGDRGFRVEATGSYDEQTRTAMRDFQRSRGLAVTGNLNPETAAALGVEPEKAMPVRGSAGEAAQPADVPADVRPVTRGQDGEPIAPPEPPPEKVDPRY